VSGLKHRDADKKMSKFLEFASKNNVLPCNVTKALILRLPKGLKNGFRYQFFPKLELLVFHSFLLTCIFMIWYTDTIFVFFGTEIALTLSQMPFEVRL